MSQTGTVPWRPPPSQVAHVCDAERLRKRLCVGQYSLDLENRLIRVSYTAVDGTYRLCFSLKHWIFSDCLTWEAQLNKIASPPPKNETRRCT